MALPTRSKIKAKAASGKDFRPAPAGTIGQKKAKNLPQTSLDHAVKIEITSKIEDAAKTKRAAKRDNTARPTRPSKPARAPRSSKADLAPERITEILRRLRAAYPKAECALHFRSPWELLVATILSAQCTDVRVNLVTPALFRDFPTPATLAAATPVAIEEYIRSTGFYRNKAKSILGAARRVVEVYGGSVPQNMEDLLTLPGAARKTANVVLGVAFGKAEGVVVDTHVQRISRRLGLTRAETPQKIEQDLMKILPRERWIAFSHELIAHGRAVCVARRPRCEICPLEDLCHAKDKTWSSELATEATKPPLPRLATEPKMAKSKSTSLLA